MLPDGLCPEVLCPLWPGRGELEEGEQPRRVPRGGGGVPHLSVRQLQKVSNLGLSKVPLSAVEMSQIPNPDLKYFMKDLVHVISSRPLIQDFNFKSRGLNRKWRSLVEVIFRGVSLG